MMSDARRRDAEKSKTEIFDTEKKLGELFQPGEIVRGRQDPFLGRAWLVGALRRVHQLLLLLLSELHRSSSPWHWRTWSTRKTTTRFPIA